ncbi:MAG: hypothetical protein ACOYYF_04525 [Chloroflexota bacterium]|jgi:hypothetical protein
MFKIFSGNWRGVGADNGQSTLFMQIGFEFRDYLHHFKGAPLAVFMAIVLHSDKDGFAMPSYDLLEQETGLARETISRAIDHLCGLEIDGQRVLLRYRLMDAKTKRFIGGNRYIIFPTEEQLARYGNEKVLVGDEPEFDFPNSGKSNDLESEKPEVGKSNLKNNHSLRRPPSSSSRAARKQPQSSIDPVHGLYRLLRPGHVALPDTRWRERAETILAEYLDASGGDVETAAAALRPYALEAARRGLSPTNLCWLTEWAAVGSIPPLTVKSGRSKGRTNAATSKANAESEEELARRKRLAAEKLGKFMGGA